MSSLQIDDTKHASLVSYNEADNIAFSFEYTISHKKYGLKGFDDKNIRDSNAKYQDLLQKLKDLSEINMKTAQAMGKIRGCESIPVTSLDSRLREALKGVKIISQDASVWVFRFNQQDNRMICKTDPQKPNLLYIVAFDFDYSAYNHG